LREASHPFPFNSLNNATAVDAAMAQLYGSPDSSGNMLLDLTPEIGPLPENVPAPNLYLEENANGQLTYLTIPANATTTLSLHCPNTATLHLCAAPNHMSGTTPPVLAAGVAATPEWTRSGPIQLDWSDAGLQFVVAGYDGASLDHLAEAITDAPATDRSFGCPLASIPPITKGQPIPVGYLIGVLTSKLRNNVVAATTATKYAEFSAGRGHTNPEGWTEAQVNAVFAGPGDPSDPASRRFECAAMIKLVWARGLIMTLRPGECDTLHWTAGFAPRKDVLRPVKDLSWQVRVYKGDWLYFLNDPRYKRKHEGGSFKGENVVVVGYDSYWGWGSGQGGAYSYALWTAALRDAYNEGLSIWERISSVPGFDGHALTFKFNEIAQKVFDLRIGTGASTT
jgi:hypothetical protein